MFQPNFLTHAFSFDSAFSYNNISRISAESKYQNRHDLSFAYINVPIELEEPQTSECKSKEAYLSKMMRKIIIFICYIIVFIFFPLTMWFSVKKIHSLQRLVIFRLGKLQPIVGPGFYMILPLVDLYQWVDLSSKVVILPTQQLLTRDGGIIEAIIEVKYCVDHVVNYVTRSQCQDQSIENLSASCLSNIISGKEQSEIEKSKEIITSHAKMELNKTVVGWGIQILDIAIPAVKILKEAEPVSPLNSVLNALKAANLGSSNEFIPTSVIESDLSCMKDIYNLNEIPTPVVDAVLPEHTCSNLLMKIRKYAEEISKHASIEHISEIYKFKIVDKPNEDKIIFLSFHAGTPVVLDGEVASLKPDIIITLSLSIMEDLLSFKLSPIQAYIGGEIEVKGDFNLLKLFNINV